MKFEITRMELVKNSYGKNDILIRQIKVMDDNGKYIKFASLNESLLDALKESEYITIRDDRTADTKENI